MTPSGLLFELERNRIENQFSQLLIAAVEVVGLYPANLGFCHRIAVHGDEDVGADAIAGIEPLLQSEGLIAVASHVDSCTKSLQLAAKQERDIEYHCLFLNATRNSSRVAATMARVNENGLTQQWFIDKGLVSLLLPLSS